MMRRNRTERLWIVLRFLIADAIRLAWDPQNKENHEELYWDLDRIGWYIEFEED